MANNFRRMITLEEGLNTIQNTTNKLQNILENFPDPHLELSLCGREERMNLYSIIYNMCTQKPPYDYSQQLYENYKKIFEDYIKSMVLPSLREKKDEILLRELLRRWSNQKTMTIFLSKGFHYLDRYYISRQGLTSLEEIGFLSFYHLVYDEMHRQVMDAILAMIDRKRAGEPIDETLVNKALTFYLEIGESTGKEEPKHFAETMIKQNAAFYAMSRLQI
ncbi:cullin-1-like [Trifolium pratense]|uniref:Uncharacterized protein n=1 Tax=Trifolium pratense TaxID=57577 RepID=A0ACB0KBU2_TRIPR|nr:cullin-1-like [Trifolium pratense]CAJ2653878.1 unnamed protein product [Trifolium pratense]